MDNVKSQVNENELVITLTGRIDSTNSDAVEAEIENARANNTYETVSVDCEDLEYTSSAGLRVFLRLRKNEPTMKMINVNSEVYEILDMTGFSEMIPVEKAYRKLSVDGCEVIGRGANGEVYRLDRDTVVKLYFNSDALPEIHRERDLARKAFVLGIPTAIPYDVAKIGDCYGSVFELLDAKSFAKLLNEEPENIDKYAQMNVDLVKKIHSTEVKPDDMPNMKDVAVDWAEFLKPYVSQETFQKLIKMINEVPVVHTMLHGDYHVKNVMLQKGETLLIDMDTLCYGHPVFELASMFNAYVGYDEVRPDDKKGEFLGIGHKTSKDFWEKSLLLYFDNDANKAEDAKKKAMVIGYTRMARRLIRRNGLDTQEGKASINYYLDCLTKLVSEVDTLVF